MGLKNSQYHAIMRKYEQKQLHSHDIQVARYEEVYKKLPEFKTLDDSIASLSIQHGKKLLDGDTSAVDALKKDLAELRNRKIHLLKSAGFPEDYLEPVYDCPDCKDTGYIGNKKCHCFKKAIIGLLYDQSNIKKFPVETDFSNFRLDYYPVSHYDKKTGRSSRSMMEDTLRICHHFIDSFGTEFNNLFFYGDVGVGKTFLSHCIAQELLDTAHCVMYFSAFDLFDLLADSKFSREKNEGAEFILDSDLLIIDDLGTELTNSFVSSQLFLCINERIMRRKSTIISTNLKLENFSDTYSERTFSRIASNYRMVKLEAKDIRIQKIFLGGK